MSKICLGKTNLIFKDDILEKYDKKGNIVATFLVSDISKIYVKETKEYALPAIFFITFLCFAWVAKTYIPNPGWSWAAAILCLSIVLFSALMVSVQKIIVKTKNGKVGYQISDTIEEAEGFALSISHLIDCSKTKPNKIASE